MEPTRRVGGVARPVPSALLRAGLPGRAHEVREKHWRTSRQCHTPPRAFAHAFAQLAAAAVLALAAGCQGPLSRGEKVEMLMARSARLEDELLATRQRLAELEGTGRPAPEAAKTTEDPFRAVALRFGKFTGGLNADGRPLRRCSGQACPAVRMRFGRSTGGQAASATLRATLSPWRLRGRR